jgi:hypothetical protein
MFSVKSITRIEVNGPLAGRDRSDDHVTSGWNLDALVNFKGTPLMKNW